MDIDDEEINDIIETTALFKMILFMKSGKYIKYNII